jgi:hypothetical protein
MRTFPLELERANFFLINQLRHSVLMLSFQTAIVPYKRALISATAVNI